MISEKPVKYEDARKDSQLRQGYLNSLFTLCPASVEALIYDSDFAKINLHADKLISENYLDCDELVNINCCIDLFLFAVLAPCRLIGLRKPHPIFVFNPGFEIDKEDEFLNFLKRAKSSSCLERSGRHDGELA